MAEKDKDDEAEEKSSGGGGKKKLIIIIVAAVLVLGGGVGAFLAMSGKKAPEGEEAAAEEGGDEAGAEGEGEQGELPGAIMQLDTFIVNLQVKGSFLKTTISLEFAEPELPHTAENDTPKIRDAIIRVLSTRTANDILNKDGKEKLGEEIKKVVNEVLESEDVVKIYFTEFIVQ